MEKLESSLVEGLQGVVEQFGVVFRSGSKLSGDLPPNELYLPNNHDTSNCGLKAFLQLIGERGVQLSSIS